MNPGPFLLIALLLAGCGGGGEDENSAEPSSGDCNVTVEDSARAPSLAPLDPAKTYRIEFTTSRGAFTVELDAAKAPCHGDSLIDLARAGFFDDTRFHRIVPGFIIQGGDPTASGTGGPGYMTVDTPPPGTKYTKGVVAMAKSQADPPGAGGSQFFVVTAPDAGLPPDYAVVGKIVEGLDTVEEIGELGDPQTEMPTERVVIERTTVSIDVL